MKLSDARQRLRDYPHKDWAPFRVEVLLDEAENRIAALEAELEAYRERHRDAKSNYAALQRTRARNIELEAMVEAMVEKGKKLEAGDE